MCRKCIEENVLKNCVASNGGLSTVQAATYADPYADPYADLGRIFLIFEPCLSTRQMVNLQPAPWSLGARSQEITRDVYVMYVILFETFQSSSIDET